MRAPFPWFGGKSRAASLIWSRLGEVGNYVEPFAGSLAVLLGRPTEPRVETINDLDANVANFWRAVQAAPDEVARWADWPVSEPDLHARHQWLVDQLPAHRTRLLADPAYFDAQVAGWWVWGLSQWIGAGWCAERPSAAGRASDKGVHHKLPNVDARGGKGTVKRILPAVGHGGKGIHAQARRCALTEWFEALRDRLRRVRVCCGDWTRVMGASVIYGHGMSGIVLDPPYSGDLRDRGIYNEDGRDVSAVVREWALQHGGDPRLRIVLCGYEGEHQMPPNWECVPWKAAGGYGSLRKQGTNDNARRERLWFSPACLGPSAPQPVLPGLQPSGSTSGEQDARCNDL